MWPWSTFRPHPLRESLANHPTICPLGHVTRVCQRCQPRNSTARLLTAPGPKNLNPYPPLPIPMFQPFQGKASRPSPGLRVSTKPGLSPAQSPRE